MKKTQLLVSFIVLTMLLACSKDNTDVNLNGVAAPAGISATMTIKQDNSGKVTIMPTGEGVSVFEVYFGDSTAEPETLNPGTAIQHTYLEGTWPVKIVGITINGARSEVTLPLTVTFFAPTDLLVTVNPLASNSLGITVKAEAKFETGFKVYFGETPGEIPVDFIEGDIITHIYSNAGTYQVRVVAVTGGIASTEFTQNVSVIVPIIINLPLDFESATLPYAFTSFGGASTAIISNNHSSGINTSSKIGALTKGSGSQTWAGSFIELSNPIDFSVMKKIKVKVWSPQANIVVKMKFENLAAPSINIERDVVLTSAFGWQELTFDFTGISTTETFQRLVLFFDFGTAGNGNIYNFDDIKQSN